MARGTRLRQSLLVQVRRGRAHEARVVAVREAPPTLLNPQVMVKRSLWQAIGQCLQIY